MTEEQIEKEALKFSDLYYDNKTTMTAAYRGWKAGYHFRDKEVEELKAEIEDLKRRNTSLLDRSGNRY